MDPYQLPLRIVKDIAVARLWNISSRLGLQTLDDLVSMSMAFFWRKHHVGIKARIDFNYLKLSLLTDIGHYVALAQVDGLVNGSELNYRKDNVSAARLLIDNVPEPLDANVRPHAVAHLARCVAPSKNLYSCT